jgi:methionine-gamma-lyase
MNNKSIGFGSSCIHSDYEQKAGASHMEPIHATTTFSYDDASELMSVFRGDKEGYIYSRWQNPTIELAAQKIARLEAYGLKNNNTPLELYCNLFSSGMGAITALFLSQLKPGEKVITQGNLYGGSNEILQNVFTGLKIEPVFTDLKNLNLVEETIKKNSTIKMIYVETPSNPTIDCYDLEGLSTIGKAHHLILAADNTFATPYLQQPFKYDFDFVVHSTTKYLNGHGNATGGALVGRDVEYMKKKFFHIYKLLGANSNAFDAWLLNNGLKTLELRMDRHCSNALSVAEALEKHSKVSRVNYCGLPSHPDYTVAKKQMSKFGGMLSFELNGGMNAGIAMMNKIQFCTLAVSLGTVDTIIQHPASMSHLKVDKSQREKYGITDGLIRLSVGIENVEDIIADLDQAMN